MKAIQLYRKHNGENSVTSLCRNSLLINMHLTYKNKASIKLVCQQKGSGAKHIYKEFPNKSSDCGFGGSQRQCVPAGPVSTNN